LGLGVYEILRKCAVEKWREESLHKQHTEHTCTLLTQEVEQQQKLQDEFETITAEYQRLVDATVALEEQKKKILAQQQEQSRLQWQLQSIQADQTAITEAIKEQLVHLHTLALTWRQIQRQQRSLQQRLIDPQQREALRAEVAALRTIHQERLKLMTELVADKAQLQNEVTQIRTTYQEACLTHRRELQQYEQQLQLLRHEVTPIKARITELDQEQIRLQQLLQTVREQEQLLQQLTTTMTSDEAAARRSYDRYHRLSTKKKELHELLQRIAHDKAELADQSLSHCSWCRQPLQGSGAKASFADHLTHIEGRKGIQLRRVMSVLESAEACMRTSASRLEQRRKERIQAQTMVDDGARLQQLLEQAIATRSTQAERLAITTQEQEVCQSKCTAATATYNQVEQSYTSMIDGDEQIQKLNKRISNHEELLTQTEADAERYQRLEAELNQLMASDTQQLKLLQEVALQRKRREELRALIEEIRRLRVKEGSLHKETTKLHTMLQSYATIEAHNAQLQEELIRLQRQKEQVGQRKGALEQARHYGEERRALLLKEQERLRLQETDVADYNLLCQILGKDGIQGMLIEQILPEIEQDANLLLAKLTDNQAQLSFESLRELKSGGMKETLDIKISDTLGIRPYELFSGGEAFRIDFALRLAISKFLARRAGTSIQTLIIDEGFGSQDEEGLHHIMESLYAIQDEFAKIIIVSHLPIMKDQFPVHFCVTKGPQGSSVQVMQQG